MFFGGQQYTDLLNRAIGRWRCVWFRDDAAYPRHHTPVHLPQRGEYAETSSVFLRHQQLQVRIVAALERDRPSKPLIPRCARAGPRVGGNRRRGRLPGSSRCSLTVVDLQLPEAEYDHDRRQADAEGDDQGLFDPGHRGTSFQLAASEIALARPPRAAAACTRSAHIFPRLQPAVSIAKGTADVSVMPGDTLTSRKTGSPSDLTMRSVRDRSRRPRAACTRNATSAHRFATSDSSSAGPKDRVPPGRRTGWRRGCIGGCSRTRQTPAGSPPQAGRWGHAHGPPQLPSPRFPR